MDPDKRRGFGRVRFEVLSRWLVDRGFAVVVPMRRGFAGSDGGYAEDFGPCQNPDYLRVGREAAHDVAATLDHLSRADFVDRGRIIVLGFSTGGWAAIAFSANSGTAVTGIINFAGGRGGRDPNGSGERCAQAPLLEATALFGRTSRIPSLWVYAENDSIFPPDVARAMLSSFRGAGGRAELVVLPPSGKEGHPFVHRPDALPLWSGPVSGFLQGLGYSVPP
jgi:dienelactone hydrolase